MLNNLGIVFQEKSYAQNRPKQISVANYFESCVDKNYHEMFIIPIKKRDAWQPADVQAPPLLAGHFCCFISFYCIKSFDLTLEWLA